MGSPSNFSQSIDGNKVEYTFVEMLGRGGFASASLYTAKWPVVLKRVPLNTRDLIGNPKLTKLVESEATILATLCHPNIVRIYHAWHSNGELVMELEYCGGKSLKDAISKHAVNGTHFEVAQVKKWLGQLFLGVAYLHDFGIVHRDLKTDNVLLTSDRQTVKIADFGTAKLLDVKDATITGAIGTVTYMAPEIFLGDSSQKSQPKVDVWALGVIAYELAVLEIPYKPSHPSLAVVDLMRLFQRRDPKPDKLDQVGRFSSELRTLIETKLLVVDQKRRATMDQVLQDPFVAGQTKWEENYLHQEIKRLQQELKEAKSALAGSKGGNNGELKPSSPSDQNLRRNLPSPSDLFDAVKAGDASRVQQLTESGADVNVTSRKHETEASGSFIFNTYRFTPLHFAAICGYEDVTRVLVQHGANVNAINDDFDSPLMVASASGNLGVAKLLIDNGAEVNARDGDGKPAVMVAAGSGITEIVKLLLENGANLEVIDRNGHTPLTLAAYFGRSDMVRFLLANRVTNIDHKDNQGRSALGWAAEKGFSSMVTLLKAHGARD